MPLRKQAVDVHVRARVGSPLELEWRLANGESVTVVSEERLSAAQNRALDVEYLRGQLGRLGNTAYELRALTLDLEGSPFAPSSVLNALRRSAVDCLTELQERVGRALPDGRASVVGISQPRRDRKGAHAAIHLLVRTPEQLDAAVALRPASITLDYLDLYGLRPSIEAVQQAGIEARVASPRILKPGEEKIADFLLRCGCPILVRPAGLLHELQGKTRLFGDFSLNAANAISASDLFALGIERLTPTHDLNSAQIATLARNVGGERIEAVAYQHLPVFHTEHCVFCRFLSSGTSFRDCGRPCERHRVALQDREGRPHPVMADVGCRNTVFGAEAQEASAHLKSWLDAGIAHFRLEFVHESAAAVTRVTRAFSRFFDGKLDAGQLCHELREASPEGVTEGSLYVPTTLFPVLQ